MARGLSRRGLRTAVSLGMLTALAGCAAVAPAPPAARLPAGRTEKGHKAPSAPVDPATWKQSQALHEALRQWRRARSTADGVPAYVVFADRTLDDLVARRPTTFPELLACHGIGPAKVENYGDELLAVIAEFSD